MEKEQKMVKRSSFLGKLFSKKKPQEKEKSRMPSAISERGERKAVTPEAVKKGNGKGSKEDINLREQPRVTTEPRVASKPSIITPIKKEDAQKAVVEGLKDLSGLLRSIQGRMEEQGERTGALLQKFEDLPETAKAQIRFLEKISDQLEAQYSSTAKVLEKLSHIPELLSGVQKILESQQKAEERRDQTMSRFRETMEKINESISLLNQDNAEAMKETAKTFEKTHRESVEIFEKTQKKTLEAFEKAQEKQVKALGNILSGAKTQNIAILIFLVLIFLVMSGILVVMLTGFPR